ncbi:Disintegrin and metalloproteinase domain-containing protein [Echinococcus granulosus]|uniref:Disintegrin and metalloproteinase domain-containing protein n=1 Tax=Echinococcus granulosus TaxID=6210 RepID=W6V2D8_ECHGR|nr:Disintegrin and metalloproteinase domain-containing protein [Echinococcus granulosus]EUB60079.1 Disintegrin and metalloproteinase domain-containing protein [Echinococcus granulosus]
MGHNLGAKHDDDFKEETPACLPSVDDPKGNYIMFASATGGDKENNNKFSVCSVNSIARLLHQVLKSESNCFFTSNGSFCGNRLTEEGEQCDCGFTREDCDDVCCYPKDSKEPCKLKKFANVGNTTVKVDLHFPCPDYLTIVTGILCRFVVRQPRVSAVRRSASTETRSTCVEVLVSATRLPTAPAAVPSVRLL